MVTKGPRGEVRLGKNLLANGNRGRQKKGVKRPLREEKVGVYNASMIRGR